MKINAIDLKIGNIIQHNNALWRVTKLSHTQPGKGGAYIQAEDGIRDAQESRGLGDVYKRQDTYYSKNKQF